MGSQKMEAFFGGKVPELQTGKTYHLHFAKCTNTSKLFFRFSDTESLKQKLAPLLEFYMNRSDISLLRIPPNDLSCQQMVVVIPERKENRPFRGIVYKITNENGKVAVAVLNTDRAKCYECTSDEIYYILEEFVKIPHDMIDTVLDGLQIFYGHSVYGKALDIHHKMLRDGKVVEALCEGYWKPPNSENEKPLLKIRLEDGSDFNKVMLNTIYTLCPGSLPPAISKRSKQSEAKVDPVSVDVYPCHLELEGDFFLYMAESFLREMETFLRKVSLDEHLARWEEYKPGQLSKDAVYVAPMFDGVELFRAKFLQMEPNDGGEELVKLYYFDYGNEDVVPISVIRAAQHIDKNLEKIPPLCHRVFLKWIKDYNSVEDVQSEVLGNMYQLTVRQEKRNGCPVVVLTQTQTDGTEQCLNKLLVENGIANPGAAVAAEQKKGK